MIAFRSEAVDQKGIRKYETFIRVRLEIVADRFGFLRYPDVVLIGQEYNIARTGADRFFEIAGVSEVYRILDQPYFLRIFFDIPINKGDRSVCRPVVADYDFVDRAGLSEDGIQLFLQVLSTVVGA